MSRHHAEQLKGKIKETVGDITGDKSLQLEGKIDQGSAAIKRNIEDAADKIADKVNPLADKVLHAVDPKSQGSSTATR